MSKEPEPIPLRKIDDVRAFVQTQIDLLTQPCDLERLNSDPAAAPKGESSSAIPPNVLKHVSKRINDSVKNEAAAHFPFSSRRQFTMKFHQMLYRPQHNEDDIDPHIIQSPLNAIPTRMFPKKWPEELIRKSRSDDPATRQQILHYQYLRERVEELESKVKIEQSHRAELQKYSARVDEIPALINSKDADMPSELSKMRSLLKEIMHEIKHNPGAKSRLVELRTMLLNEMQSSSS